MLVTANAGVILGRDRHWNGGWADMFDDGQYEEGFMERISEPLNSGEIRLTEEEEDELLYFTLEHWLKRKKLTQEEILSYDVDTAKFIEQFNLQHLVYGGWTPLQKE